MARLRPHEGVACLVLGGVLVVAACAEDDPARHLPDAPMSTRSSTSILRSQRAGNGSRHRRVSARRHLCGIDVLGDVCSALDGDVDGEPAEGSVFGGWSGACTGESTTCEVTLEAAASVTATFALEKHTVTLIKAGQGMGAIHGDATDCTGTCTVEVDHGAMLSYMATPTGLSVFGGWGGACSGSGNCSVTVTSDITIQANFALDNFTLSVTPGGTGTGTVTSNPGGHHCGAQRARTRSLPTKW